MADTLREYLIGLGFRVDEAGWRKFNAAVTRTGANVAELGAETVATSLAIAAMVERVARHYEELYYSSQRSKASVENLRSYGLAAKQVGLTVEAMTAAQESFSTAQRMNPGIAGLAKQYSTATDKGEQLIETITELKKRHGEPGYYQAARVASLMGLDENTFRMLWMNLEKFKEAQAQQKQIMKENGINATDAADKFVAFAREMNLLGDRFKVLGERIALDFLPWVSKGVGLMNDLVKAFSEFNKESSGWLGMGGAVATGTVGAGLGGLLLKRLYGRLFGAAATTTATTAAGAATGAAAAGGGAVAMAARGAGAATQFAARGALGGAVGGMLALKQAQRADWESSDMGYWMHQQRYEFRKAMGYDQDPDDERVFGDKKKDLNIGDVKGMNAQLVERLRQMRADMPEGIGGFTVKSGYRSPEEQARLFANRGSNPYPVAPPGKSSHGLGEAGDLKFETAAGDQWFRAQMSKYGIHTPVPGDPVHFERADYANPNRGRSPFRTAADLAPAPGGGGDVTLNQRTEIKVEAGPTATATAQGVLDGQSRVNGDAVRNLGAKVR